MADKRELKVVVSLDDRASASLKQIQKNTLSLSATLKTITGLAIFQKSLEAGRRAMDLFAKSVVRGATFIQMEEALLTVARNAGISSSELDKMRESLREINTTGLSATETMKRFLQSGLADLVDQVQFASGKSGFEGFIETVKDFAAVAGVQSKVAIDTFTDAINTGRPILLKQFGLLMDLNAVYGEYAKKNNTTVEALDGTAKRMAFLNEIARQGAVVQGVYNDTYNTAGKNLLSMKDALTATNELLGAAFEPTLRKVTNATLEWLKGLRDFLDENRVQITAFIGLLEELFTGLSSDVNALKGELNFDELIINLGELIKSLSIVITTVQLLGSAFSNTFNLIRAGVEGAAFVIQGLNDAILGMEDPFARLQQSITDSTDRLIEGGQRTSDLYRRLSGQIAFDVRAAYEKAQNASGKFAKGAEGDMRRVSRAAGSAAASIGQQITKEMDRFKKAIRDARRNFKERLREMIFDHKDRVDKLRSDFDEEVAAFAKKEKAIRDEAEKRIKQLRENEEIKILKDAIRKAKAISRQAGETTFINIRELEQELEEKERLRDAEITAIEQDAEDELKIEREKSEERRNEIQESLNEELAILEKHAEDVKRVGERIKEDDITRLKRQFKEELKLLKQQNKERLAQISAKGFGAAGTKAGQNWIDGFNQSFSDGLEDTAKNFKQTIKKMNKDAASFGAGWQLGGPGFPGGKGGMGGGGGGAGAGHSGAIVYAQTGLAPTPFKRRGMDTIPAMISRGEAIMSRKAVEKFVKGELGNNIFNFDFSNATITNESGLVQRITEQVSSILNRQNELNILGIQ